MESTETAQHADDGVVQQPLVAAGNLVLQWEADACARVHGGQMPRSYGYVQCFRISLAGNLALVASTVQHGKLEPWTHGRQLAHVMLAATALLLYIVHTNESFAVSLPPAPSARQSGHCCLVVLVVVVIDVVIVVVVVFLGSKRKPPVKIASLS